MPALSRSGRIILLLGLNITMFLTEIIVGYKSGSLALIADAFHMLSDVLSQVIALYAIRLASKTEWEPTLSYGWQRAELLGALYNGVFLLALCFSIFLDAIERFFKPEDIEEPKLVLIVGSIGLACNLLGLVLFHDHAGHGHNHGHSHGHSHGKKNSEKTQNKDQAIAEVEKSPISDKTGDLNPTQNMPRNRRPSVRYQSSLERISPLKQTSIQNLQHAALEVQRHIEDEERHQQEETTEEVRRHSEAATGVNTDSRPEATVLSMEDEDSNTHAHDSAHHNDHAGHDHHSHQHDHKHDGAKRPSGQDLNMHGIFLHVLGDALGSVGVIFTALFLWLTDFSWRFYMDPIISLFICGIIVYSALPLVRSASFILLQGVPVGVEIEEIRKEIKAIPDVISIHDLHIWQLTNIKMVASLHVLVTNQEAFERVSRTIKTIMHQAGVHSTTIQPEFPGTNPYSSRNTKSKDGLRLIKDKSEDEARNLLSKADFSSCATSVGAQSEELPPEGSTRQAVHPDTSLPGSSAIVSGAGASTGGLILTTEEEKEVGESNCTQLCVDGEQACDVESCCTLPVKR
ncbi:hypothetical protein BGZ51_008095 [Haplosporangium sp. Z 767]|nr:hypothetical protein BGZ51_008095 [Haplosporangium sp. Z 767]KAF9184485.1 hypothetical protein BGZ50_003654 [Haplosporangium sp. Z 11]